MRGNLTDGHNKEFFLLSLERESYVQWKMAYNNQLNKRDIKKKDITLCAEYAVAVGVMIKMQKENKTIFDA